MESTGFEWGWDALVAIGTLTLAAATMLLAWSTQRAAKATALDVSTQWRPAIVPGVEAELIYTPDERLAMVRVRNAGRGPAFHVEAALSIENIYYPPSIVDLSDDELMNFAIFRVDEAMDLYFTHLAGPPTGDCKLLIDYDDVNGNAYSSRIEIREVTVYEPHEYRLRQMDRVELLVGKRSVPWGPPGPIERLRSRIERWRERGRWRAAEGPDPF